MVARPNGCPITSQAIVAKVPTNMEAMPPLLVLFELIVIIILQAQDFASESNRVK